MASRVVLVPIQVNGVELLVETSQAGGSEETSTRLERAQDAVSDAINRAEQAIVAVAVSTVTTIEQLASHSACPDKVEVKFGLKFSAQGNIIVAGASSEATLEVTLTYPVRTTAGAANAG